MITPKKIQSHFVLAAILACSLGLLAKPREKTDEIKTPSGAELVLVPTIVTGESGEHVTGLKKEDFHVFENGVEQSIVSFDEISSDAHRWEPAGSSTEFSNFFTGDNLHGRLTLIVLDLIDNPCVHRDYACRQLLTYLSESIDQREPTALYTLTERGIHVIHDFTADPHILTAALRRVVGDTLYLMDMPHEAELSPGTASAQPMSTADVMAVQSEADRLNAMLDMAKVRTRPRPELSLRGEPRLTSSTGTLYGFRVLAQAFRGTPDRKSLIWIGREVDFDLDISTWQMLADARIALYPVRTYTLGSYPSTSCCMIGAYGDGLNNPAANTMAACCDGSYGTEGRSEDDMKTFKTVASLTGGRAYSNSKDLGRVFREAVRDSSQYYMLGYYLDRSTGNEGWRRLRVKSKRQHVDVSARSAIYVSKNSPNPESRHADDVETALASRLDDMALALTVKWGNVKPGVKMGKQRVDYQIHLGPDAALLSGDDNNHLHLEFFVRAKTSEQKWAGDAVATKVDTHMAEAAMAELRNKGVSGFGGLELAPGEYTVRFVVRDDLSGRMGSVSAPLKVE